MASTARILSGQRSLTSKIQGIRLNKPKAPPVRAVKNCGDVATIISVFLNKPAQNAIKAKLT